MSVSIIIRKKEAFKRPMRVSVIKMNRYAWQKYAHKRKRSFSQRVKAAIKTLFGKRNLQVSLARQVAMF